MSSYKLVKVFWSVLLFMLLSKKISSQINYPRFVTDSLGQKIVELTIEQAQKLDNSSEMLVLVEKLNMQLTQSDSICVKVISENEKVISIQKMQISKLNESLLIKDKEIENLQSEIKQHELKEDILTKQVENRKEVIVEKDKEIKKLKRRLLFTRIIGGAVTTGLLFLIIIGL